MDPAPFVLVARVVKAHGLKGEVSVASVADLPFVLHEGTEVWFVPPPAGLRAGVVEGVRQGPKGPLVKFSGIDTIDSSSALRGAEVLMRASDVPAGFADDAPTFVGLRVIATWDLWWMS
jgi:16S rRNA processing protein RimM